LFIQNLFFFETRNKYLFENVPKNKKLELE
jgi:hypothetical protein